MKMRAVTALFGFAKTGCSRPGEGALSCGNPSVKCLRVGWGAADGRNHGWHRRPRIIKNRSKSGGRK